MENTQENSKNEDNFALELAKSFVQSAAVTAGVWVGMIAVGAGIQKVEKFKENKKKKAQEEFDKKFKDIIKDQ